ncbi:MAG: ribonuclease E/G, partial [Rhodoplanes sp.]
EAVGEKGPKLTARLPSLSNPVRGSLAGARPPSRLARGPDPILGLLRDAVAAGVGRVIVDDGAELSRLRGALPELADRLEAWLEPAPLFAAYGVDEAIDRALARVVALPSGGRLTMEETEALVVIDVDTGATSGRSASSAALACDLEAAAAIGREIVARDLAGIIMIDFVPLRRRTERERVVGAVRSSLAGDDRQVRIAGWTRLGLVEMSRERRGPSLADRLTADCTACGAHGREISPRWVAGNALRAMLAEARRAPASPPSLVASPAVLEQLRGPLATATAAVEDKLGAKIALVEADVPPAEGLHVREPEAGAERGG